MSYTLLCSPGQFMSQSFLDNLASNANSCSVLAASASSAVGSGSYPYSFSSSFPNANWLTELNNIRSDIVNVAAPFINENPNEYVYGQIPLWVWSSISGEPASATKQCAGWPLGEPTVYNSNLGFFFTSSNPSPTQISVSFQSSNIFQNEIECNSQFSTGVYGSIYGDVFHGELGFAGNNTDASTLVNPFQSAIITSQTYQIIIGGGTFDIPLECDFYIYLNPVNARIFPGSYVVSPGMPAVATPTLAGSGSVPLPTIDGSGWIAGAGWDIYAPDNFVQYVASGSAPVVLVSHVSGNIAPGTYSVTVTVSLPVDTWAPPTNVGPNQWEYSDVTLGSYLQIAWSDNQGGGAGEYNTLSMTGYNNITQWNSTASFTRVTIDELNFGPGSPAQGICSNGQPYFIDCSSVFSDATSQVPIGIWNVVLPETDGGAWQTPVSGTFPQPTFAPSASLFEVVDWSIVANTNGLWTGNGNMGVIFTITNQVAEDTIFSVPWNVTYGGAPANDVGASGNPLVGGLYPSAIQDGQIPYAWTGSSFYPANSVILDSNGNFQQSLANGISNNSLTQPAWSSTVGNLTSDHTINWKCIYVIPPSASFNAVPAYGNMAFARYPFYCSSMTTSGSYYMPPTSLSSGTTAWGNGKQWYTGSVGWSTTNAPGGWFIYNIGVYRKGNNYVGQILTAPSSQISVEIGCMRNGSFTSFGSFNTGQQYTVMWPVFGPLSQSLVVNSSEDIDLQAVAIIGGNGGSDCLNPMFSSYINDPYAAIQILNQYAP